MASEDHVKEFPDVGQKLAAPKKLSNFEKERQAAEAKKLRDEADNAAALREFEESFGADGDADNDSFPRRSGNRFPPSGPRGSGLGMPPAAGSHGMQAFDQMEPRRAFDRIPGAPPPPPSLKRKRALDEMREQQEALREQALLGNPDSDLEPASHAAQEELQHEEDHAPRPTVYLTSLPPNMVADDIKLLLREYVPVHSVQFLPPTAPTQGGRLTLAAIATLSSETPTIQIDNAVSALKEKYLGCGFYLSISRHLSSTSLHQSLLPHQNIASSEPFGAERRRENRERFSRRAAPPPMDQRGFAPPESYDTPRHSRRGSGPQDTRVLVRPPLNLATVKAIHTIVDHLLLEPDPERALETEAMLMALPEVQQDERFAFLYDSRSPAGVYYRFCLWAPEDPEEEIREQKRRLCGPERLFQDAAIDWLPPYVDVPFPDLKSLAHVVTDMDYISSDEESDEEETERKFNSGREGTAPSEENEKKHLTPLQHARLVHLLSRLPTSNARLRKGDVARVTNFAINHAAQDAEDIANTLILNVHKPFAHSLAAQYESSDLDQDDEDVYEPDEGLSNIEVDALHPATTQNQDGRREDDPSNAKLVALYVISDLLSASSTAGARNAWKYRQIFEAGFKSQKTFEHLGKLDRELAWGRMKAEQWKRKINVVFGIWEGWSVFPSEVHEELKRSFFEPALTAEEKAQVEAERLREEARKQDEMKTTMVKEREDRGAASLASTPKATSDVEMRDTQETSSTHAHVPSARDHSPDNDAAASRPSGAHRDAAHTLDDTGAQSHKNGKKSDHSGEEKTTKVAVSLSSGLKSGPPNKTNAPRRMRAEDMFGYSDEE